MSTRRRPVRETQEVAALIRRFVANGIDGDDLIFAVEGALPNISRHTFAGALALFRAEEGAPGYLLIPARARVS